MNKETIPNIYINQNIDSPQYLFHGSPILTNKLIPKQSHDSNNNQKNINNAIFLFPSFLKSVPYAFKDTIKKDSKELNWNFIIPNTNTFPIMIMENVNINEQIEGYIYVFKKSNTMYKDNDTYQYKCYHELIPIDIIKVKYQDFQQYFKIRNTHPPISPKLSKTK